MTATVDRDKSPSPTTSPTPAIGAIPELSRCVSTASSITTDSTSRTSSQGGDLMTARNSPAVFRPQAPRQPSHGHDTRGRRRGYMRPQATDFAASAKSRESVMSLGSIAHLQYYFARTGLLDGKGGQLARKKQNTATLDLSALDSSSPNLTIIGSDVDSSYASMGSSPDLAVHHFDLGNLTESPGEGGDESFDDSFAESESGMLPPTVSTYHHKEKVVPKPPTRAELKSELESTLADAGKALKEAEERKCGTYQEPPDAPNYPNMPEENTQGWFELQGMQILDVVTLAIRAAKLYYTAHELPDRLDSIKSEKQIRMDLLAVMDVLKQMALRGFKGGLKDDEVRTMNGWVESVWHILRREEEIEAAEQAERASWTWLDGDWSGREMERERAFLMSMSAGEELLPEWTPVSEAAEGPTPFLEALQNGLRLVKLHNAVVMKSRRRFGAIPMFHTDTQKPYRRADNLRYWIKAAELRFEVMLKVDVMGIVYNTGPGAWKTFEVAILKWCRHVREEVVKELAQ